MTSHRAYDGRHELGLNSQQRKRLETLVRRRERLRERLDGWTIGDPSWTRAEFSAISWAIRIIENVARAGVLEEVE